MNDWIEIDRAQMIELSYNEMNDLEWIVLDRWNGWIEVDRAQLIELIE